MYTGAGLLTDKQQAKLTGPFKDNRHAEVEATWGIYQRMIAAYREPDRSRGRELMLKLIESISTGVPEALTELDILGRTLVKRSADILAYFDTISEDAWTQVHYPVAVVDPDTGDLILKP